MYVPNSGSKKYTWSESYELAKSYYFMGMRGYLATITESQEDSVLDNISGNGAWAGGARVTDTDSSGHISIAFDSDSSSTYGVPAKDQSSANSSWYWVNGPEAGYYINTSGKSGTAAYGTGVDSPSTDSSQGDNNRYVKMYRGGKYGAEADTPSYSNWRRDGGTNQEPNNYVSTRSSDDNYNGEYRLQVHYPSCKNSEQGLTFTGDDGKTKISGWNDLPDGGNNSGNVQGFFVEFSKYVKDDGTINGNYDQSPTATVIVDVENVHEHLWVSAADSDSVKVECDCGETYSVTPTAENTTYTGQPYTGLTVNDGITGVIGDYTYQVSYESTDGTYSNENPPTDAGEYKVIVTLYEGTEPVIVDGNPVKVEKTFTIGKKDVTVTALPQEILIGDPVSSELTDASATGLCDGHALSAVTIEKVTENNVEVVKPTSAAISDALGTDVSNNYNFIYVGGNLIQNKRPLTVDTNPTADDIVYGDKLSDSQLSGGVVKDGENIVPGHWEWVSDDTQDPENIRPSVSESGTRTFHARFIPDNPDMYETVDADDITLTIEPKPVEITWNYTGDGQFTYNGTEQKPTASVTTPAGFPGGLPLPTVDVTVTPDSELRAGIDATPEGKSHTAVAELTGDDAVNYVIAGAGTGTGTETLPYKINPAELTVTLKNQDIKKKEEIHQGTDQIASDSGLVGGDTISDITIKADRTGDEALVTGDTITIKNGSTDVTNNYNVTYVPGKLKEDKIPLTKDDNVTTLPTAEDITYGDTLKDSVIKGGVVEYNGEVIPGTWKWDIPDELPDAGVHEYSVIFVPDDEDYTPIQFDIPVTINRREVNIEWGANEFIYNGEAQIPTAAIKDGDIIDKDKESIQLVVSGEKVNANAKATGDEKDHYVAEAELDGTASSNYVIKSGDEKKNFKIDPLELDNDSAEVMVGKDDSGNPNVSSVFIVNDQGLGILAGRKLTETTDTTPGDYKQKITEEGEYIIIEADFAGNYKGKAKRTITKPKKTEIKTDDGKLVGEMEIFVQVDDSVDKSLNPNIERVAKQGMSEAESVLDSFVETFNDVILENGDYLKKKIADKDPGYVTYSDQYIDLYEVPKSAVDTDEQNVAEEQRGLLQDSVKKNVEDPIYLDLTMRQEYEVVDSTGKPVTGTDMDGNHISQVKVSEPIYTNDGETVKIEFDFPAELINDNAITKCYVLRIHNRVSDSGVQTGILEPEYVVKGQTVTSKNRKVSFYTNKFSTYVVMYTQETKKKPSPTKPDDPAPSSTPTVIEVTTTPYTMPMAYAAPKTGDSNLVYVLVAVLMLGIGIVVYDLIKKRRA